MVEKTYDDFLSIRTGGIRQWQDNSVHYNRLEPTPYKVLEKLIGVYSFSKKDKLVDFGSGRGRVLFYLHNKFNIPVVGIEYDMASFEEACANKESYISKLDTISAPIVLVNGLAEDYKIKDDENKFYFFNPFSLKIFKLVIDNIIESIKVNKRPVDLILYYPMPDFKLYLKRSPFKLSRQIILQEAKEREEEFLIYSYGGK